MRRDTFSEEDHALFATTKWSGRHRCSHHPKWCASRSTGDGTGCAPMICACQGVIESYSLCDRDQKFRPLAYGKTARSSKLTRGTNLALFREATWCVPIDGIPIVDSLGG
jgi:hypothetical protein